MDALAALSRLAGGGIIVFAVACSEPPTAPSAPQLPLPVMTTFTVTNGWTGEAVPGALVSASGTQAVTDSAGQVPLLKTGDCLTVDVKASGFLERRTCSSSAITLWPIAHEEEREATRTMAFLPDQTMGSFSSSILSEVGLAEDLGQRLDVMQTWTSAADEIKRLTLDRISIRLVDPFPPDYPDGGVIITSASGPPVCRTPSPQWPVEAGGFCWQQSPEHWLVLRMNVLPDRLTDGSVALRALLMGGLYMHPHAMPGLLNRNLPDRELSTFERKTLHMIGLRKNMRIMWPDLDWP